MPRKVRQDVEGYNTAIGNLEKEYKRALGNTTRSKEAYQGALDRIEWLLEQYRREQRERVSRGRPKKAARTRAAA